MRLYDIMVLAFNGIRSRKLRSGLTSLGIIIGSAAFVALVSLGAGVEASILNELGDLNANEVRISPGAQSVFDNAEGGPPEFGAPSAEAARLTVDDEEAVRAVGDVQLSVGTATGTVDVTFRSQTSRFVVQGRDVDGWLELSDPELAEGRLYRDTEERTLVMGAGAAHAVFDVPVAANQQILVNGERFRVVGVLGGDGSDTDRSLYMPRDAAWAILGDTDETLSSIVAVTTPGSDPDEVAEQIERALLRSRGLNPDERDFSVTTTQEIRDAIDQITGTVRGFLGAIAAISLLVGGIGIANTMFMTVMERAKQIGILKAVGMTRREVVWLFLFESSLLGFLGGLIGALLGAFGALFLAPPFDSTGEFHAVVTAETFGGMVAFAVLIGSLAGLLPAFRAASVPPMESLQGQ